MAKLIRMRPHLQLGTGALAEPSIRWGALGLPATRCAGWWDGANGGRPSEGYRSCDWADRAEIWVRFSNADGVGACWENTGGVHWIAGNWHCTRSGWLAPWSDRWDFWSGSFWENHIGVTCGSWGAKGWWLGCVCRCRTRDGSDLRWGSWRQCWGIDSVAAKCRRGSSRDHGRFCS